MTQEVFDKLDSLYNRLERLNNSFFNLSLKHDIGCVEIDSVRELMKEAERLLDSYLCEIENKIEQ